MDGGDHSDRPLKKRRFFVDEEPAPSGASDHPPSGADVVSPPEGQKEGEILREGEREGDELSRKSTTEAAASNLPPNGTHSNTPNEPPRPDLQDGFDTGTFTAIVGEELPPHSIRKIRNAAGDDLERAVNIYFDGSWKTPVNGTGAVNQTTLTTSRDRLLSTQSPPVIRSPTPRSHASTLAGTRDATPTGPRYIGAFGVGAWATRSGTGLVQHGEHVNIERAKTQPIARKGRGGRVVMTQKADVLTRFTNRAGQEIGRLPRETAEWVSTLLDQRICRLDGVCVFAPDRIRVNDTIYLQLRCYLRVGDFQSSGFNDGVDDNRSTALFEEQESTEERNLRLRQVALVKLFDEIGLAPTSTNDMTREHKKEGLLRAAEMSEQYDRAKKESKGHDDSEEEEPAELEEDQLDTLYKKAQSFDFNMPEAEPPPSFNMRLRTYQKQALYWMLSKEQDTRTERSTSMHPLWEQYTFPTKDVDDKDLPVYPGFEHFYVNPYSGDLSVEFPAQDQQCLGGILADEMGLGKTIEMMSLVHAHRNVPPSQAANVSGSGISTRLPGPSGLAAAPYTTLVIAPTSLLSQWENEALKASQPGTMKVLVYYGTDKSVNLKGLCSAGNPAAPNVIVTSYGTVLSEYRQAQANQGLFSVNFFRIILDEAHGIKNRRSKTARACYELQAQHRWALTGTPIVNRLEDLFSLVRFLKVEPWNNFSFWKTFITVPFESKDYVRALNVVQTVLEPLVLRRTKTMKTPDGEPLVPLPRRTITVEEVELPEQEREIYDLIYTRAKQTFNANVEAGTLLKSYSTIFAQILRLRQTCCHPILTRNKAIVADEEDAAAAAEDPKGLTDDMDLQELINRFTATTETANPDTQTDSSIKFTTHALKQIQNESSGECPICSEEPMIEPAVTACWHSACKKCLEDYIRHQTDKGEAPRCFSCRGPISSRDIFEVVRHQSPGSTTPADSDSYALTPPTSSQAAPRISLRRINPLSPSAHTSAKIHSLINHLHRVPPDDKSVVFSQFTSFLDLISPQLDRAGIPHVRLDGTMPQKARAAVLAEFTKTETFTRDELDEIEEEDTDTPGGETPKIPHPRPPKPATPRVLLISLRAGGVGLNLTAANHVFMMDPWWSFAVEAQAIDRVHRMGQLRDVSVTRFVVRDSIEGRMLRVQDRKMNIAGSLGLRVGGDGGDDEKRQERIEELRLLFD